MLGGAGDVVAATGLVEPWAEPLRVSSRTTGTKRRKNKRKTKKKKSK